MRAGRYIPNSGKKVFRALSRSCRAFVVSLSLLSALRT